MWTKKGMMESLEKIYRDSLKKQKLKIPKYTIDVAGLACDSVANIIIDNNVEVVQYHPNSTLFLHNRFKTEDIDYKKALFYADAISFITDCPSIAWPIDSELKKIKFKYVSSGRTEDEIVPIHVIDTNNNDKNIQYQKFPRNKPFEVFQDNYLLQQRESISIARESKHGPNTYVICNFLDPAKFLDLELTKKYLHQKNAVALYSNALKQIDYQYEFLSYYRIVELHTKSNGKKYVEDALKFLNDIKSHKISIYNNESNMIKPIDLMRYYKKIAQGRVAELLKVKGDFANVAKYLYNDVRCGIAHGEKILNLEYNKNYFEIGFDLIIMKLIARNIISENESAT